MVGDHEDASCRGRRTRRRAACGWSSRPRWPGRSGRGRRSARALPCAFVTPTAVVASPPGAVGEGDPLGVEEEDLADVAAGLAAVLVVRPGRWSASRTRGPPAATIASISFFTVWSAATVPSSVGAVVVLDLLQGHDVGRAAGCSRSPAACAANLAAGRTGRGSRRCTSPPPARRATACGSSRAPGRRSVSVPSSVGDERVAAELVVVQRARRWCRSSVSPTFAVGKSAVAPSDWICSRPVFCASYEP